MRSIRHLLDLIPQHSKSSQTTYVLKLSVVGVYDESSVDMLTYLRSHGYIYRERPEFKGSCVGRSLSSFCEVEVTSYLQSKSLLARGLRNIQIFNIANQKNTEEMHTMFSLHLVMRLYVFSFLWLGVNSVDTPVAVARFVDLAGCEPQIVQKNRGQFGAVSKSYFASIQMLIQCVARVVESSENKVVIP